MNLRIACILVALFLPAASAFAKGGGDFAQANQRFAAGDFSGAAAAYEDILRAEGPRASVYYNLGNAYQKLGRYGPAILAYERARLVTPRDPDLLVNLAHARKAAAAFEEIGPHPRFDAVAGFLSRNEWSWLVAGGVLYLGVLSVFCGVARPMRPGARKAACVSVAVSGLLIACGAAALHHRRDDARRGVVLTEQAALHLSPFEGSETLGTPGPGKIVLMLERRGSFHYIEVPGTKLRGWLPDKEVAAVLPERPGS